jgi:hypothetical protein
MMIKNLLALLGALPEVTVDPDTQQNLLQLGSKLEGFLTKRPNETDWQNVQVKIEAILGQHPTLAQRYQQLQSQLQAWTGEELQKWLSSLELRRPSPSEGVPTLGVLPSRPRPERSQELENIVVEVATIILKSNKVADMASRLLPAADKVVKPGHSSKQVK